MKMRTILTSVAALSLALGGGVAYAQPHDAGTPSHPVSIIDPDTPPLWGMVVTASEEFNGTEPNSNLFYDRYLPHWSTSEGTKARYEVSDGTLKLRIDADQEPWDPVYDGSTRVSSLQTYQRDYLHKWTKYPDRAQQTEPFRGLLQKYGYFEVRAKVASGGGLHSAWWMTGANQDLPEGDGGKSRQNGEVDIFEVLGRNNATRAQSAIHPWGDRGRLWPWTTTLTDGATDLSQDFHTYGFEWTPKGMRVYVDGEVEFSTRMSPSYPMLTYLGIYEKHEPRAWTGPFDASVPYPKIFEVDYFRAYQFEPGEFPHEYLLGDGVMEGQTRSDNGAARWVGGAGNGVTLTHVYVPHAGAYDLEFDYRSGEPRDVDVAINGRKAAGVSGLDTGSFRGAFQTVAFTAELDAGWNTVSFDKQDGLAPDLKTFRVLGPAGETY